MTPAEFNAWFDEATTSLFRLEALQTYAVSVEDASFTAFREGAARPERSVRTSPWLRRIAVTTTAGVDWSRVRIVDWPLTEYTRYELLGYIESQAVGERILLADGRGIGPDFWLRDGGTDHAEAIVMHYTPDGQLERYEVVIDPERLTALHAVVVALSERAIPLNEFLASNAHVF